MIVAADSDVGCGGHVGRGVAGRHPHEIRIRGSPMSSSVQILRFLARDSLNFGSPCHVAFWDFNCLATESLTMSCGTLSIGFSFFVE